MDKIRLAKREDADKIVKLFEDAKEKFKIEKTFQWAGTYPNIESFLSDLENNVVYVYEEDEAILGASTIQYSIDHNYDYIDGAWLNDEPYASIHRIVVDRKAQCKNIGSKLYKKCEEEIYKNNVKNVRVDTYKLNNSMIRLLEKNGFTEVGIIYLSRTDVYDRERIAFHKVLE